MKNAIVFLIALSIMESGYSQQIEYYQGEINLSELKEAYRVRFNIGLQNTRQSDTLKFYLQKNAEIIEIQSETSALPYRSTQENFIGVNQVLYIPTEQIQGGNLTITYRNSFKNTSDANFKNNKDRKELNIYTVWFPLNLDYGFFEHTVTVNSGGTVVGSGPVSANSHSATVTSKIPSFDIPLVIGENLKKRKIPHTEIEICHDNLNGVILDQIESEILQFYADLKQLFGKPQTENLTIAVDTSERNLAYARPAFVSISVKDNFSERNKKTLAHEISHLWWNKADVMSYEDWLNEAFAEYSSLLLLRSRKGEEDYRQRLNSLEKRVQKLAPIKNIDKLKNKNSNEVITYKGAFLLTKLEARVGQTKMLELLHLVHNESINTSQALIKTISDLFGEDTGNWFRSEFAE